uniref:Uncharacterized protein n=1 Tax=Callorhinchus milii TaxID=7868 RepID=A0A4W3GXD4_CALMI
DGCAFSHNSPKFWNDREEGKPLLIPVPNPSSKLSVGGQTTYSTIPSSRFPDEQALLNTILTKTAQAVDSQSLNIFKTEI